MPALQMARFVPPQIVNLFRITGGICFEGLSREEKVQDGIGHAIEGIFVGLRAQESERGDTQAYLFLNFSMHCRFGALPDVDEPARGCQQSCSRILGPTDEQDSAILALNEDRHGHGGIEIKSETAARADHGRFGRGCFDGLSAPRAMVELEGGVHFSHGRDESWARRSILKISTALVGGR